MNETMQIFRKISLSYLWIFFLVIFSTINAGAQTYLKFEQLTGTVASQTAITAVSQSSGTAATVAQMNDINYTTGALTTSMINAWVTVDMGSTRTISYVDIAAMTATANLNGRNLQVSIDNVSWTNVITNITGASITALTRYSFSPVSARYVRVFNPSASAGIVGVSEIIPESISKLIVASGSADGASLVQSLPFVFNFKGTAFTQFSASANGLMRLGATAVTGENVNSTRSTANTPKLFAYWDNLATGNVVLWGVIGV